MSAKIILIAALAAVNAVQVQDFKMPQMRQELMEIAAKELAPGEEDTLTDDDYDQKALDAMQAKAPKENEQVQLRFVDRADDMVESAGVEDDSSDVQLMFNVNNRAMVQISTQLRWDDADIPTTGTELDMDDDEENLQDYEHFDFS